MQQEAARNRPRQAWRNDDQRRFAFVSMVIGGWCDAAGLSMFARLGVSFMSGDATQFGLRIFAEDWSAAAKFVGAQVLFVPGAALGRYQRTRYPEYGRTIALSTDLALLATTATVGGSVLGVPAFGEAAQVDVGRGRPPLVAAPVSCRMEARGRGRSRARAGRRRPRGPSGPSWSR